MRAGREGSVTNGRTHNTVRINLFWPFCNGWICDKQKLAFGQFLTTGKSLGMRVTPE
jgi:hypothetical protein